MTRIVILAEKANAAADIAKALEISDMKKTDENFIQGMKGDKEYTICHSQGHALRLKEPEEMDPDLKRWKLDTLPIPFDDGDLVAIDSGSKRRLNGIKRYLKCADIVINAGDAGREGELIQRWILHDAGYDKPVERLWASSLTTAAIGKAFSNLLGGNSKENAMLDNLYAAGRSRAIMDKYIGYNYSRLISLARTDGVTVNYGRCKTPLTNAIIKRDDEIAAFVKRPFSYIRLQMRKGESVIPSVQVDGEGSRIEYPDHNAAAAVASGVSGAGKVISLTSERKNKKAPKPFDILSLQKEMAKKYDMEADKTLSLCQSLYDQKKVISYPRTDSRYLTSDLKEEVGTVLRLLAFGKFEAGATAAASRSIPDGYFSNTKVTDHHGIIPIVPENGSDLEGIYAVLSEGERLVYDEIVRNFIALFLPPHSYDSKRITFEAGEKLFLSKTRTVISLGWKKLYASYEQEDAEDADEKESMLDAEIAIGDFWDIEKAEIEDTETKPKQHFTTASLLDYMRIHGIGTGATRDSLIKELTEKKGSNADAAVKKNGKYFVATDFGRQMDAVIPDHLKSIEFLSRADSNLSAIEAGKLTAEDFIKSIEAAFKKDYAELTGDQKVLMSNQKQLIESSFSCPFCKIKLIDKGWGYACRNWKKDGSGCNFSLSKTFAGKKLTDKAIGQLLYYGRTKDKLKGFKSKKTGNKFSARIKCEIVDGKANLNFDFE